MAPTTLDRSHRLQKSIRHGSTVAYGRALREQGIKEIHTVTHKAPRLTASSSTHRRQKQTLPLQAVNEAGRHTQHVLVLQLTPTIHHETTNRKLNRGCHVGRLVEHDPGTNLSNHNFAGDILLFRGSLKHTTTMLDDSSSYYGTRLKTTPHEKANHLQHDIKNPATAAVLQWINIQILPTEGEIKYLGHVITFNSAVQVKHHRVKRAWATFEEAK